MSPNRCAFPSGNVGWYGFHRGGRTVRVRGEHEREWGCTLVFGWPLVEGDAQGQRVARLTYCSPIGRGVSRRVVFRSVF